VTTVDQLRETEIDPITLEVVQNALASIGDEMALTVMRTAYSGVVKDALDYSTALCDRKGQMICQGLTIVMHLGSFPGAVGAVLEQYAGRIAEGDMFILNDPYGSAGIHLPDIFVIKPVFVDGELEAFSCAVAHHTDVGGIVPGSNSTNSVEIYQDGLRIPLLKLYDRGVPSDAIFAILAKNVRVPDKVLGDLRATIAAVEIGERGYRALAGRYGAPALRRFSDALLDYSERLAREEIRSLPDGTYTFTDHIDGDGSEAGTVTIRAAVTIASDHVIVDFEGSSPQVRAGINSPLPFTISATAGALRLILDPAIPNTSGYFRVVEVRAPRASVMNPVEPGACGARGITGFRIMDAVHGALAEAVPDRVPAGGDGGNTILSMGGYGEGHDDMAPFKPFVYVDLLSGSRGAAAWGDGAEGVPHPASNVANTPIEMIESELPIRVEAYGLAADTGGAGKHRGALSQVREVRFLAERATLQIRSDKRHHRPHGLAGGASGSPSWNILNPGPDEIVLPTLAVHPIARGDVLRHLQAGGGGWGDPLERDVELVESDVRQERITVECALRDYGVVINPVTLRADHEGTRQVRAQRRQSPSPVTTTSPDNA
jgi:N-methylhydantoinase B